MDILDGIEEDNFTLFNDTNGPLIAAFLSLELVSAFFANLFVLLFTLCKSKSRNQPSTIFLTSLLMADFVLISTMSFGIISAASGGWIFGQTNEIKHGLCQFVAYTLWYGVLLSVSTLAVLSFDRCLIIKPFFYKRFIKATTAKIVIVIIWIVCFVLNITPFFGFGRFVYGRIHGMCVPEWEQIGYNIYMLIIFLFLLGCIVITSLWTFCFIRKFLNDRNEIRDNIYVTQQRRLCGIFGVLLLVYFVCFIPSVIVAVLSMIFPDEIPNEVYAALLVNFFFITVANPLIQSIFRRDIKVFLKRCIKDYFICKNNVKNDNTNITSVNVIP
jgi:hypothetical protein